MEELRWILFLLAGAEAGNRAAVNLSGFLFWFTGAGLDGRVTQEPRAILLRSIGVGAA